MDSNAHSDIWGHSNNKRGNELVDYIVQEGLEVHNKGKENTYREIHNRHNSIMELKNWPNKLEGTQRAKPLRPQHY